MLLTHSIMNVDWVLPELQYFTNTASVTLYHSPWLELCSCGHWEYGTESVKINLNHCAGTRFNLKGYSIDWNDWNQTVVWHHWLIIEKKKGCQSSNHSSKYLPLCSSEERKSYWFATTWGWGNDDIIFMFGWSIPLTGWWLILTQAPPVVLPKANTL